MRSILPSKNNKNCKKNNKNQTQRNPSDSDQNGTPVLLVSTKVIRKIFYQTIVDLFQIAK